MPRPLDPEFSWLTLFSLLWRSPFLRLDGITCTGINISLLLVNNVKIYSPGYSYSMHSPETKFTLGYQQIDPFLEFGLKVLCLLKRTYLVCGHEGWLLECGQWCGEIVSVVHSSKIWGSKLLMISQLSQNMHDQLQRLEISMPLDATRAA